MVSRTMKETIVSIPSPNGATINAYKGKALKPLVEAIVNFFDDVTISSVAYDTNDRYECRLKFGNAPQEVCIRLNAPATSNSDTSVLFEVYTGSTKHLTTPSMHWIVPHTYTDNETGLTQYITSKVRLVQYKISDFLYIYNIVNINTSSSYGSSSQTTLYNLCFTHTIFNCSNVQTPLHMLGVSYNSVVETPTPNVNMSDYSGAKTVLDSVNTYYSFEDRDVKANVFFNSITDHYVKLYTNHKAYGLFPRYYTGYIMDNDVQTDLGDITLGDGYKMYALCNTAGPIEVSPEKIYTIDNRDYLACGTRLLVFKK